MLTRLADDTPLVVRPIRPDDKQLLERGLRDLSEQSAYRRFLSPKHTFSRSELRYLTEVDGENHVALVVEDPAQAVRRLIGVGRFVRLAEDPQAAEVAITVCDDWQRRGVGSLLSRELAAEAQSLGIHRFTATMASDNVPAHRLMQRLDRHLSQRHAGAGVDELVMELAA